jgi:hypothetical protein
MPTPSPAIIAVTSAKVDAAVISSLNKCIATFPTSIQPGNIDLDDLWKTICQTFVQAFVPFQTTISTDAIRILTRLGAVPGQPVFIYYYSFDKVASSRVSIPGLTLPSSLIVSNLMILKSPQKDIMPDLFEIQALVPSLDLLQDVPNYKSKRNGVLMWLPFQVTTTVSDTATTRTTSPYGLPVWLPPPVIGLRSFNKGAMKIGYYISPSNRDLPTDFFGKQAGGGTDDPNGQLRWYPFSDFQKIQMGDLNKYNFLPVDQQKDLSDNSLICLPPDVAKATAKIRQNGKRIPVARGDWNDDGVQCTIPDEPGFVIVWRDDIPSLPLLFGCDALSEEVVQACADQLWKWTGFGTISTAVPYPQEAGKPILLGVSQVTEKANNFLASLLNDKGLTVDFAFLVGRPSGSSFDAEKEITSAPFIAPVNVDLTSKAGLDLALIKRNLDNDKLYVVDKSSISGAPLTGNGQTKPAEAFARPDISSVSGAPSLPNRTFQIQLAAKVTITKDLNGQPLQPPLPFHVRLNPVVPFKPLALTIPGIAVFFTDVNFAGVPMVVLPSGAFGLTGKWDANNPAATLAEVRNNLCNKLGSIKTALDALSFFYNDNTINMVRRAISCIDAWNHTIVDATGDIADLRGCTISNGLFIFGLEIGGVSYDDRIASMIMIGPPAKDAGPVLTCYEHSRGPDPTTNLLIGGGNYVKFGIRDNTFINAIPDFGNLSQGYSFLGTTIPAPERLDTTPSITNFGRCITSLSFG